MKTTIAAFAAALLVLGVTAALAPTATVGNGQTNNLSTYVTGQTSNVGASTSGYPAGTKTVVSTSTLSDEEMHRRQLGSEPSMSDAEMHRMQLGR